MAVVAVVMLGLAGGAAHADGTVPGAPAANSAPVSYDPYALFGPVVVADCQAWAARSKGVCVGVARFLVAGEDDGAYCGGNHGNGICYALRCDGCEGWPTGWGLSPYWTAAWREGQGYACPEHAMGTGLGMTSTCICDDATGPDTATASQCVPRGDLPRSDDPPQSCPIPADKGEGNPIHVLRGVKREVVDTGLAIGRLTLRFTYDNSGRIPRVPAELAAQASGWNGQSMRGGTLGGPLWSSNLARGVTVGPKTISNLTWTLPTPTVVSRSGGRSTNLLSKTDGTQVAEPGNRDRLVGLSGGGWRYDDVQANTQETFDATGRVTALTWVDGTRITFTYSDANTPVSVAPGTGLLLQASDNLGRSLSFGYAVPGAHYVPQIQTITDAAGQVTRLGYDERNNLSTITWADGSVRSFVYDNPTLPWALTGIRDEAAKRYATFGYDSEGRAISTEHAGGVNRYSVSYTMPPSIQVTAQGDANGVLYFYDWNLPQGIVMTLPNGSTSSWSATSLNGKNYFTGQTQQAGAGCGASTSGLGYDENGNVVSQDDFNGTRTCHANDMARNLPVSTVVGLSQGANCSAVTAANAALPAGALKTSTQWHPAWSLQARQAAPGQITTWVYNGQPDPFAGNALASCAPSAATLPDSKPIVVLCKQVEQATTDEDGHLGFSASLQAGPPIRVRTWTYNERGQVLTSKGTRSNVNDTETRSYYSDTTADHTTGDVATLTDARGKVTTFNRYNKLGQVLQSTDANGAVTLNTYDLRQRLLTSSVNGRSTSYEYDPVGQLKKVTQPDGSWIGLDYDDAHRQVAAYDNRGNRIDYVLDNAGQRTTTSTKDPNGALKTNLARVMDALGRLQRGTGEQ